MLPFFCPDTQQILPGDASEHRLLCFPVTRITTKKKGITPTKTKQPIPLPKVAGLLRPPPEKNQYRRCGGSSDPQERIRYHAGEPRYLVHRERTVYFIWRPMKTTHLMKRETLLIRLIRLD